MKIYLCKSRDRRCRGTIYISEIPYEWDDDLKEWCFRSHMDNSLSFHPGNLVDLEKAEIYEYLLQFVPEEEKPVELELP